MQVAETVAWLSTVSLARHSEVEERARLLLLDTLACAVRGFVEPEIQAIAEAFAEDESGPVSLPGLDVGLTPPAAAFVFAAAACWHEACEGLASAHGRPGLHAVPVAMSLGLARLLSLGSVLEAILWGYELGGRFGQTMRIRPGMHVDGTWGALASTAAASRALGLLPAPTMAALGIAACQIPTALYLPITQGRTARNTYVGHAALTGMAFARAAAAGVTAPDEDAFAEAARLIARPSSCSDQSWAEPGRFLLLEGYLKPFAAARHIHYPASAALALRRQGGWHPAAIRSFTIATYEEAVTYCGNRNPRTPIQAQFSLSYGTARMLLAGTLDPDAYALSVLEDPMQRRLEGLAVVVPDPAMQRRGARVTLEIGEERHSAIAETILGDPSRPMTRPDVLEKALRFMGPVLGGARASAMAAAICDGSLSEPFRLA
jgi:2-methylcitrate dehydratase PrpD